MSQLSAAFGQEAPTKPVKKPAKPAKAEEPVRPAEAKLTLKP